MGLGKTTSAVAYYYYGRAASARRSTLSRLCTRTTQSRTRTSVCGSRPTDHVLYVDRGVIVLNKPPGLVSQGTSRAEAPVAAKRHHRQETTTLPTSSRTAFDDVLDGTATALLFLLRILGCDVSALTLTALDCLLHNQVSNGHMASIQFRIRSID